jgi:hypothetical protein
MRNTFLNQAYQSEFDNKGVLIIKNYLNQDDLENLYKVYEELESKQVDNFFVSNWNKNKNISKIHFKIYKILSQNVNNYLLNYKPVLGGFAVKKQTKDNLSEMGIHQDWSFVNEEKYTPLSIWVPLCDVNIVNGCMSFSEGSHKVFKNIRGFNIKSQIDFVQEQIKNSLTDYAIKAGDAIVLNSRIAHYSRPNNSNSDRIAAMLAMVPAEATLKHYARKKDNPFNLILEYDCPDDFYITHDILNYPAIEPTREFFDLNNSEKKELILKNMLKERN